LHTVPYGERPARDNAPLRRNGVAWRATPENPEKALFCIQAAQLNTFVTPGCGHYRWLKMTTWSIHV
jgi:hypothetical protein